MKFTRSNVPGNKMPREVSAIQTLKRLSFFLFVAGVCCGSAEAGVALHIVVHNCTGRYVGQYGNGGAQNAVSICTPDGKESYTAGISDGTSTTWSIPQAGQGTYGLRHYCTWPGTGYLVCSTFYPDTPTEVTWHWYVFDDGCPGYTSTNSIDDRRDRARKRRPCDCGMPVWTVSEPYISLWLHDEPLGYQPALGPRVSFELSYKQREAAAGFDTNIFSVGPKWNCSWLSYVAQDATGSNVVYFAGGGQSTFLGTNDYLSNARLTGDTNNGFTLSYPDGSSQVYGFIVTNSSGAFQKAFLTQRADPQGQRLRFAYDPYNATSLVIRLQSVTDADGWTNRVFYSETNGYSTNLIRRVVDPFGRTCWLDYDSFGRLTNITDVAGLSSSFAYGNNTWITNLSTPYGSTAFS